MKDKDYKKLIKDKVLMPIVGTSVFFSLLAGSIFSNYSCEPNITQNQYQEASIVAEPKRHEIPRRKSLEKRASTNSGFNRFIYNSVNNPVIDYSRGAMNMISPEMTDYTFMPIDFFKKKVFEDKIYRPPKSPEEFINYIKDYAIMVQERTGIPASVMIAQTALETGWGKSVPKYNFFGIKTSPKKKHLGQYLKTTECENGKRVPRNDYFRVYNSTEECFRDYADLIQSNYKPAMKHTKSPIKFAKRLHELGYATDSVYSNSLNKIIKQYDLTKYDTNYLAENQSKPSLKKFY